MASLDDTSLVLSKLKPYPDSKAANDNVLSKIEVLKGPALPVEGEQTLSAIEKEVPASITRREACDTPKSEDQRLSIAPASRLPTELLSEIFLFLSNEDINIPPVLTQNPWVLGRVCSRWRSISRSDPRLWGCPQIEWISESESPVHKLECALSILPPAVHLSIKVRQPGVYSIVNLTPLIPYIHRCKILDLSADINDFDVLWLSPIPHNAFINLHRLSLDTGDISRFEERIASGMSWGFTAGLLHRASHLQSVSLSFSPRWSSTLLSMGIPWNQLTYLYVDGPSDIPALYEVLSQCSSLARLYLTTYSSYKSVSEFNNNNLYLPHLSSLHVSESNGRPPWIPPLHHWECLTSLTLSHPYPADYLRHILQKCVNLTQLSLCPPSDFPVEPLSLPSIRSLELTTLCFGPLPLSRLVLPSLEKLYIFDSALLDLSSVSDMLSHSRCPLFYFYCTTFSGIPYDLLLSMPSVSSVLLRLGKLSAPILHDIGVGTLLPNLDELKCIPESIDAMLDMLEARVDRKVQLWRGGSTTLTIRTSPGVSEMQAERLKNLHLRVPRQIDMKIVNELNVKVIVGWHMVFGNPAE